MLGEVFENYKRGVLSKVKKEGFDPFAHCRSDFQSGNATIANLECVLSDKTDQSAPFSELLRAPANCVKLLKAGGISAVSLANNHTHDHGEEAFQDMIDTLNQNGICTFGSDLKGVSQDVPVSLDVGYFRLGLLAYNLANLSLGGMEALVGRVCQSTRRHRERFHLLVVSMHWGLEYVDFPPPWVVQQGKRLIDNGVDVVYGHHSHRVQGVARYRHGVIAPSLGNFVFDSRLYDNRITGILRLTLNGSRAEMGSELLPYVINRSFQPVPAPQLAGELRRRTRILENLLKADDRQCRLWTKRAVWNSGRGHLYNRIQMRVVFLLRILRYRPHLWKILTRKITRGSLFGKPTLQ